MSSAVAPLGRNAAERLDTQLRLMVGTINGYLAQLYELVQTAKHGNVHETLGFASWTTYLADVFTVDLRLEREQRRELVGYLSAEGMSNGVIADVVGADRKTVRRDLAQVGEKGPPEKVTGRDGKTYKRGSVAKPPVAPKRERPGATRYSKDIQTLSASIAESCGKLTNEEIAEAVGAAQLLYELLRGETILRKMPLDRRREAQTSEPLGQWDEASWDCEKINDSQRLVKMNNIMWDALDGLTGVEGEMLIRVGRSLLDLVADENKVRGIARMMHSIIEFSSAYKTQQVA